MVLGMPNIHAGIWVTGKVRGVGVAMAMQGSSIAALDVGGADIKLNEDGSYTLALGCSDMGTGGDTILSQIAAECLETPMNNIVVFSVDTDISPDLDSRRSLRLCYHLHYRNGSSQSLPGSAG